MIVDPERVLAVMRDAARAVVLPRFGCLTSADVRTKKHARDLVTVADVEAEALLSAALTGLVAGSAVVGEEGVAADPGRLAALRGPGCVWIIDPVDGTCNFVDGVPVFALIVALAVDQETVAGWIYDPTADVAIWAQVGAGAFRTAGQGQERLRLSQARPLGAMVGSLTPNMTKRLNAAVRGTAGGTTPRIVRYGSAGCEYMDLARGIIDYAVYSWLKPWDHAAGVLIHGEAGGFSQLMGEPPRPYGPAEAQSEVSLLLAPDQASWQDLALVFAAAPESGSGKRTARP